MAVEKTFLGTKDFLSQTTLKLHYCLSALHRLTISLTMFSRISAAFVVASALLAAASPIGNTNQPASQCNTGPVQCCQQVQTTATPSTSALAGLLGIVLEGLSLPIGLSCNPINIVGLGGNSCASQPVCCENNTFNGLIALGCTPINLNL